MTPDQPPPQATSATAATEPAPPTSLRHVTSPAAGRLAGLCATYEDLQTVLRCCERLLEALTPTPGRGAGDPPDEVLLESVWTLALLSYARCFRVGEGGSLPGGLTEADVIVEGSATGAVDWHRMLLNLKGHHADPAVNPRERFSVGAAQDADGHCSGVAVTSVRQPSVDEVTVRQTGALAFALCAEVDTRISAGQAALFEELKTMAPSELGGLDVIDVAALDAAQD